MSSFLFFGGGIYTMHESKPVAEAVLVEDTTITFVGDLERARALAPDGTEEIDLAGGMLLPGFIDAHDHFAMMGIGKMGADVSGAANLDQTLDVIRAYVKAHPDHTVYRGFGWLPSTFPGDSPRREWLDEITGDVPMIVHSADFHDLWFNTAAMRAAGVDASTPDLEENQYFVRDPDGTPTGHAIEGTGMMVAVALDTFGIDNIRESQKLTIDAAPAMGITSYFEAGVIISTSSADSEFVYADLVERDKAGKLDLRVFGSYWTRSESDNAHDIAAALTDWNARLRSEHVSIAHLKMWADGTLFSGGSLLLAPTCGDHGSVGRMTFSEDHITAQLLAIQEAGFDMHIHVDGDGSAQTVLNAMERALAQASPGQFRHVIAHNTVVSPDDIPRYAALGVIANCTPLWGTDYLGKYATVYTDLLGAQRVEERVMPYGDLTRSGAVVTYGADLPGVDVPEIPPLIQIEAAVTRKRPGFPDDKPFVPRQSVDLEDALRAYTINAAFQLRAEDQIGSIEEGKHADLVALGRNLFDVPPEEIHAVPVVMTMMDGRITHRTT